MLSTGSKNDIIRQLELSVRRSLKWFVCLIHTNELPLRQLYIATFGRKNYLTKRVVLRYWKKVESLEKMPVISFEKMEIALHNAALDKLSTDDQRYFCKNVY